MVQVAVSKKCFFFFVVVGTFWLFSILWSSIKFCGLCLVRHIGFFFVFDVIGVVFKDDLINGGLINVG